MSGNYLIQGAIEEAAKARLEDRELLQQFQEIEKLSEEDEDKVVVKKLRDVFLTKKKIQDLATR